MEKILGDNALGTFSSEIGLKFKTKQISDGEIVLETDQGNKYFLSSRLPLLDTHGEKKGELKISSEIT